MLVSTALTPFLYPRVVCGLTSGFKAAGFWCLRDYSGQGCQGRGSDSPTRSRNRKTQIRPLDEKQFRLMVQGFGGAGLGVPGLQT